jgi:hypothetical protein
MTERADSPSECPSPLIKQLTERAKEVQERALGAVRLRAASDRARPTAHPECLPFLGSPAATLRRRHAGSPRAVAGCAERPRSRARRSGGAGVAACAHVRSARALVVTRPSRFLRALPQGLLDDQFAQLQSLQDESNPDFVEEARLDASGARCACRQLPSSSAPAARRAAAARCIRYRRIAARASHHRAAAPRAHALRHRYPPPRSPRAPTDLAAVS